MIKFIKRFYGQKKGNVTFKYRENTISFETPTIQNEYDWDLITELNQFQIQALFSWLEKKLCESKYTCDVCYEFKMPDEYIGQIKCTMCSTQIIRSENQDSQ
jgi:hypothetical protein